MSGNYDVSLTNWEDGPSRPQLARYFLARGYLEPDDHVLDVACGTGYGTELLSHNCMSILGIDVDPWALGIARKREKTGEGSNYGFAEVDLNRYFFHFSTPKEVTVCFETLEHLNNPISFMKHIRDNTSRLIIFSVPIETEEERAKNIHHLHCFTEDSVQKLVCQDGWKMFHSYRQGLHFIGVAWKPKQ